MTRLRTRAGLAQLAADLVLLAVLVELFATLDVGIWIHVAYLPLAVGMLIRPRPLETMVRATIVTGVCVAAILRWISTASRRTSSRSRRALL